MSDTDRSRPYVVLEEGKIDSLIRDMLEGAAVALSRDQWEKIDQLANSQAVYTEVARVPSRNAAHALTQVGRRYDAGVTPPLVAVSERMFRPRQVNVAMTPSVSIV